jgi:hypothetical protein
MQIFAKTVRSLEGADGCTVGAFACDGIAAAMRTELGSAGSRMGAAGRSALALH